MSMDNKLQRKIDAWLAAGVIDAATAERIAGHEAVHGDGGRLGRLAFSFGGQLLAAGILLFIAANWSLLSPAARFALVAATVVGLHGAGAWLRDRSPGLSTTLHAVGTVAFGGGIFLLGQTFNLAVDWPEGILLWAVGAAIGLLLLRDWPHVAAVAVLVPLWLVIETDRMGYGLSGPWAKYGLPVIALLVLGAAYLSAVGRGVDARWRRALASLGSFLVPVFAIILGLLGFAGQEQSQPVPAVLLGLAIAIGIPLAVGWWLRGREAWPLLIVAAFAIVIMLLDASSEWQRVLIHLLYLCASAAMVAWGLRDGHSQRVNLGVLGFGLTIFSFYFSNLYDKLGRSLGLIGMGLLFLGGGRLLERTRRRLLERMQEGT